MAAAVAGALALPAPARAVDHVSLHVLPSNLAGAPGWRLGFTVPARELHGGEIIGATLARSFRNRRAEEAHGLRARVQTPSVVFDGRRGRWNTRGQLGQALSVNMRIVPTGPARPREEYLSCRGAFAEVPVSLRGMLVLRTETAFFRTIRRVRLRGLVVFNRGGPVDCTPPARACTPWTDLSATAAGATGWLQASNDTGGRLGLGFREPATAARGAVWYHWLNLAGFAPVTGELPTLEVRVPPGLPADGTGTFRSRATSESTSGSCQTTTVEGTFDGSFRVRFAGWGLRTLAVSGAEAAYRVAR